MNRLVHFALVVACCCPLVQSAHASIQIAPNPSPADGNYVKFDDGSFRTGIGGPFLATLSSTSAGLATSTNKWYTFCVEADGAAEFVSLGATYRVGSTSQYVAAATNNVVTNAAKFLYYAYGHDLLTSLLGSYVNTAAGNASVQEAIWSLVAKSNSSADPNDYTNAYSSSTSYWLNIGTLSADASALRAAAITAVSNATNLADAQRIRIVNPDDTYPAEGVQAQSMLYEVPETTAIAIWSGLGLLGFVVARCRRQG